MEEACAIGVDGRRDAVAVNQPPNEQEVAMGILLGAKHCGENSAGRIVDRGVEDQVGAAVFEPGMVAAVHLDEEAGLRHALATAAMPGGPTGPGTTDPGLAEQPSDGRTRETDGFALGQELGEVRVIAAGIEAAGQRQDTGADLLGGPTR